MSLIKELKEPDNHSYTMCEAINEAKRCLNCKKPSCIEGCPISQYIPEFISELAKGNLGLAKDILSKRSSLSAICGRVCPHEKQCVGHCILNKKNAPVQIGKLEQFVADFDIDMNLPKARLTPKTRGKVAVVGSGPASLTVAYDLAGDGFNVVVYEAQQEPGGVLLYGIPNFRLPKDVVRRQIKRIEEAGVTFINNCIVGTDITVDNMFESGFDAVFIGTGTAVEKSLDLKNSDAVGIFKAQYFLRMVTLCNDNKLDMSELPVRKNNKVIVIGAGNVAMDAAITARRLGARVELVYRRTKDDMPCLNSEYEEAIEEGVIFNFSTSPVEYMVDDNKLCGLRVQCVDGERTIKADNVIVAIGSKPANRIISTTKGVSPAAIIV